MRVQAATTLPIPLELLRKWAYDDVDVEHALEVNDENFEPRPEPRYPYDGRREDLVPIIDLRTVLDTADTSGELAALTDLPLKGQIFHIEAENRLFCRPREAKKLHFK